MHQPDAAADAATADEATTAIVAAAPATARRSGLDMTSFVIKQYPAKEQAELKVSIKLPGSWFNNLSEADRAQQYEVQAYDFEEAYRFPKSYTYSAGLGGTWDSAPVGLLGLETES